MKTVEERAIEVKELATLTFRLQCSLSACEDNIKYHNWLASLWGESRSTIESWAEIHCAFPADEIRADVPLRIYRAAIETDDPLHWLQMAVDTDYRKEAGVDDDKGIWSVRQLKDAAGIAKGERVSTMTWLKGEAIVKEVDDEYIVLSIPGWKPTGEKPHKLKVMGKEIFANE